MALRKWREREAHLPEPNEFLRQQILGQLVLIEERDAHWGKAVEYLEELKQHSPAKAALEGQIEKLRDKIRQAR